LNEKIIELENIAPKDFWGAHDTHLETIKKYYPKLKIVARGTVLKAFGEAEVLDEFEKRFRRLMTHFTRFNTIDDNVIMRVIEGDAQQTGEMPAGDQILVHGLGGKLIKAITPNQQKLVDFVAKNDMVFAVGPAGTGKTYLAMAKAVQALQRKEVSRIILTRPAVEAGERLGFLPGTLNDKIDPYLRPLFDALGEMLDADAVPKLMAAGTIEVAPLAYMRGRTLNDCFVILDEAQNTTPEQMKMFLTRLGFNSKMVITGDITQVDLPAGVSGLKTAEAVLKNIDDMYFATLTSADVVRHSLVARIVDAYTKFEQKNLANASRSKR